MLMTKRFLKLGLCLTVFISLFALSVQAAETVKPGRYVTDAGEFTWELTLNADNTFELVRTDYEGLYNDSGVWIADDNGNVLINIAGLVTVLSRSGGNILTLWGTQLYYDPTSAPVGVSAVTTVSDIYGDFPPEIVPDADLLITTSLLPATATVSPAASAVYVDGEAKSLEAYNIAGSNYFKLRDIAFVLNGTEKQFDIGYDDSSKDVTLIPATPYTAVGGEMARGNGSAKTATASPSTLLFHGDPLNIPAYNIAGSNFFKLVDLMRTLNVGVVYSADEKSIYLSTDAPHMGVLTISDITIFPNEELDDSRPQSEGEVGFIDTVALTAEVDLNNFVDYVFLYPTADANSLSMNGSNYKNALALIQSPAVTYAVFELEGKYSAFSTTIGMAAIGSRQEDDPPVTLNIYGNGVLLKSLVIEIKRTELEMNAEPIDLALDVSGVKDLRFELEPYGYDRGTVIGLVNMTLK